MKNCDIQQCGEMTQDWQKYCYKHAYIERQENEKKMQEQQPQLNQVTQQQIQQVHGQIPQPPVQQQPQQIPRQQKEVKLPNLQQKDQLITTQVAFKKAIEFLIQTYDLSDLDYEKDILPRIEKITGDFYKIIVLNK